eukprot:SAG31_NODE_1321_length_8801_cov_7.086532_8_plen_93_part_00
MFLGKDKALTSCLCVLCTAVWQSCMIWQGLMDCVRWKLGHGSCRPIRGCLQHPLRRHSWQNEKGCYDGLRQQLDWYLVYRRHGVQSCEICRA